ncbi:hypothetical protein-putative related to sulfatases [hydrothermal vent metagenome]|uniref:DUF1501 domain-containing protein n=1 Tax=hydrothermal vent metagenome TaxID=652676 RepID=A0A3B1E0S9_9ZZZZ
MKELLANVPEVDRRRFLEYAAKSMLGVSIIPTLGTVLNAAPSKKKSTKNGGGKAKNIIYLFMAGAMSHIDTFDLKPGHKNQGETSPIQSNVTGMKASKFLPNLAKQYDKMAIINSMYTQTADHVGAEYMMRTSYKKIATTRHPSIGPWIQKFQGRRNETLPDTVLISPKAQHPSAGFFDPTYSPLPIGNPNTGLQNTKAPSYLTDSSFEKRIELINKFDKGFRNKYKMKEVQAYTDFYTQATTLLGSDKVKAFDLNEEKKEDRDKYGRNTFGQGCMLARRLIENNVRCVEVSFGSWDMHRSIYSKNSLPKKTTELDQGLSALLGDLSSKGLLDETLVVLTTEFGRSPVVNTNGGRDHHPTAFSSVLAGGGVKGGRFYGKSDKGGVHVEDDGISPEDFNATIAYALGLPLTKVVTSPTGRPFKVAHDGEPIKELF